MVLKMSMSNAAGLRRRAVTIQIATDGPANSMGEVIPVYLTSYTRFASASLTSGREFIAAMSVQPMLNAIIKLPYDSKTAKISPRDRIVDGDKVYNISEVSNEGLANEKIVLWCVGVG